MIVIGTIGLLFVTSIILAIKQYKKVGYSFIVSFLLLGLYFVYNSNTSFAEYENELTIVVIGVTILIHYYFLFLGSSKNNEKGYKELNKELKELNDTSELLRKRFINTIELLSDGLCFQESEDMCFATDTFTEITGIKDNYFSLEDYLKLIHQDDIHKYSETLKKLSKKTPTYNIKYRVKKDKNYQWINEVGKVLEFKKKNYRISSIKRLDPLMYPETEIELLNNLPKIKKMFEEMSVLTRNKTPYYLIIFELSNIPIINEKYGRDIGDLMMGKYLSKIQFRFLKESNSLFRIDGIKFGFIIREKFKFDILERGLQGTGEMVNMEMEFGGVKQKLFPKVGLSESPYEGKKYQEVYEEAMSALKLTMNDDFTNSFHFHR
jgi:GGDEF domain-containing protein